MSTHQQIVDYLDSALSGVVDGYYFTNEPGAYEGFIDGIATGIIKIVEVDW